MGITDELRKWVHDAEDYGVIFTDEDAPTSDIPVLLGIADHIDEQHRKALEKVAAMIDKSEDMYNLGFDEAADYVAGMVEQLEERVSIIERKLSNRGER